MDRHAFKLSPAQQRKLLKGVSIQLKPSDLTGGDTVLHLPKTVSTRVNRAVRQGKGMRLQLSPEQLELNGGSLKSFGRALNKGAKQAGRFLKANSKNILKTAVKIIAPTALKLIEKSTGIPVTASQSAIIQASVKGIDKSTALPGGKKKGKKNATPAIDLAAAMRPDLASTLDPVREMAEEMDYDYDNTQMVPYESRAVVPSRTRGRRPSNRPPVIWEPEDPVTDLVPYTGRASKKSSRESSTAMVPYSSGSTAMVPYDDSQSTALVPYDYSQETALVPYGGRLIGGRTIRRGGALRPAGGAMFPAGGALRRRAPGIILTRF